MRRSVHVVAPLLASAAVALLSGCRNAEVQRCVDEKNHVVDPSFCKNLPANGQQPVAGTLANNGGYYGSNGVFFPHFYRFYYGGGSGGFGSIVSGGSYAPVAGHSYSLGTTRGGFGSSFSGGGEGGGE
jgi:hypothetical protein